MALSQKRIREIRGLNKAGLSNEKIAKLYDVQEDSVRRYLSKGIGRTVPNILIADIETAPLEVYSWGIGSKVSLGHYQIKSEWYILSWAGKWLLKDGIISDVVTPAESLFKDDARICQSAWDAIEKADIVVAHNAVRFDIRKLNARFIVNSLPPPSPYQVIDTLKQSQKIAAFSSHKLDHLTKQFGLAQKDDTDFDLWVSCIEGDKKALKRMLKYNISDIYALEGLYLYLRPWMKSHPNLGLYCNFDGNMCPNCMNTELDWGVNCYYTPVGRYEAFRCSKCGAIGSSRFSDLTVDEKKNLVKSVAR